MPETPEHPSCGTPAPGGTSVEERVARTIIVAHRARLGWMLRIPEWIELFEQGVAALALPGRRQGIGWVAALEALPIEHKHQLVRWVAVHFNRHLSREVAQQLCRVVGLERFSEIDLDSVLTLRQWGRLREAMLFRLAREHARYKHAQHLLFIHYHGLVEPFVGQIVMAERHRADCAQEARVALLHAIDRVDTSGDFRAYASSWIRRAIRNFLVRQRLPVYAPVNLVVEATATARDASECASQADAVTAHRLQSVLLEMLRHPTVSFDAESVESRGAGLAEVLADADEPSPAVSAEHTDLRGWVMRSLDTLTDKQRDVLVRRFGVDGEQPWSLLEIAREAGISHQQVSMRERRALQRLERVLASVVSEYDAP